MNLKSSHIYSFQDELLREASNSTNEKEVASKFINLAFAERIIFFNNQKAQMCYFETLKLGTKLKDDEILATANIGIAETYRNADKMKTKEHYKSAWSSLAKIRDEYTFFRGFSLGDSVIGHSYASAQKDSSFPLHKVMTEEFLEAIINGGRLN